jgi:ring-1,2-phenylacetyl-CoA epoxidase subunit PaaE
MAVTITRPARRRPVFHELPVASVDRLTEDSLAIAFAVPPDLRDAFAFRAGQHLTVRRLDRATGEDVRRSYSICSSPAELATAGRLRIGVKEIPGGAFSAYAARDLRAGDTVEVLPPLGSFTTDFDPARARRYGAVVAGSGITPVLSLASTALATEPASTFTILYGNRYARSVMFAEELADLKDRYPARLQVVHVLSREPQDADLLSGRLDADRVHRLLDSVAPADVDEWFICGPFGMLQAAREVFAARGVPAQAVRFELFHAGATPPPPPPPAAGADADCEVTMVLDGRASAFSMGRHERVLDAALKVRPELPYACRGGVCSTCRARVLDGEVTMARNFALEPVDVAAGYVLTCQSSPVTGRLVVDYDA